MFSIDSLKESLLKFLRVDKIVHNLSGYAEARLELLKIEIKEEILRNLSKGFVFLLLFMIGFMAVTFLSLAIAYLLNEFFQKDYVGFLIVGGIYLVAFTILWIYRGVLTGKVNNILAEKTQKKERSYGTS